MRAAASVAAASSCASASLRRPPPGLAGGNVGRCRLRRGGHLLGDSLGGGLLDSLLDHCRCLDLLGDLLCGSLFDRLLDRVAFVGCELALGHGLLDRDLGLDRLLDDLGDILCDGLLDDGLHLGGLLAAISATSSATASSPDASTGVSLSISSVFFFFSAIRSHLLERCPLVLDREDAGDLPLRQSNPRAVLERAGGRLEAQVEQLAPSLPELCVELLVAQGTQLLSSQRDQPPA